MSGDGDAYAGARWTANAPISRTPAPAAMNS